MNRDDIQAELRRAQADFHDLVARASAQDLRRRSDGTRWTNRQLLFHMVLGYGVVRTLLPMVRALGRLGHSRGFAATLNAGRRPFHWINYVGPCVAARLLTPRAITALLDHTIGSLRRRLAAETARDLGFIDPELDVDAIQAFLSAWILGMIVHRAVGLAAPPFDDTLDVYTRVVGGLAPA